jgi:glycosyltransferase involved in cell wall biosynthesis
MKILLVGHSCRPNSGSEPGLTWQFAWHLSRFHEVWVMATASSRESVEQQLALTPNRKLHFIWIPSPRFFERWPNAYRELTLRLRYLFYQRAGLREAGRQHHRHQFDLVHHLSWGTISAPPLLWRLPIPLVWGPVGGAQTAPPAYRRYFGSAWREEFLRTLRVHLVTKMPGLRRTVRNCALIFSTNPETTRALQGAGAREVRFHPNIGITEEFLAATLSGPQPTQRDLVILWAGRLIPIKGLALALEAFSKLDPNLPVRLRIAGDGPLKVEMQKLAQTLGITGRVEFLGAVPWLEMKRHYQEADLFLFTSLRDSSGQVLAEAMASGLPIVALDHQGVGAIVPPQAGMRVSVDNPDQTVRALTREMHRLLTSQELRESMSDAARAHAQSMSWNAHAEIMSHWYAQVMAQRQQNGEYAYAAV